MCKTKMHFATLSARQNCHSCCTKRQCRDIPLTIACASGKIGNVLFHSAVGMKPAATVMNLKNSSAGFSLQLTS